MVVFWLISLVLLGGLGNLAYYAYKKEYYSSFWQICVLTVAVALSVGLYSTKKVGIKSDKEQIYFTAPVLTTDRIIINLSDNNCIESIYIADVRFPYQYSVCYKVKCRNYWGVHIRTEYTFVIDDPRMKIKKVFYVKE